MWTWLCRAERVAYVLGWAYFLAFLARPERFMDARLAEDPMVWTAFGSVLLGLLVAWSLQRTFPDVIRGMVASGRISGDGVDADAILRAFETRAVRATALAFLGLGAIYHVVLGEVPSDRTGRIHLRVGGSIALFLLSVRFGHAIATGTIARRLARPDVRMFLDPGHPDRAAGLGRLGFYYFDQALIVLLPAAFMSVWLLLLGVESRKIERDARLDRILAAVEAPGTDLPDDRADPLRRYLVCPDGEAEGCPVETQVFLWREMFLWLTLANVLVFAVSWALPMIHLRRSMRRSREMLVAPAVTDVEGTLRDRRGAVWRAVPELRWRVYGHVAEATAPEAARLDALRACPAFPIPIWTVLATIVSNVSALIGILAVGLG